MLATAALRQDRGSGVFAWRAPAPLPPCAELHAVFMIPAAGVAGQQWSRRSWAVAPLVPPASGGSAGARPAHPPPQPHSWTCQTAQRLQHTLSAARRLRHGRSGRWQLGAVPSMASRARSGSGCRAPPASELVACGGALCDSGCWRFSAWFSSSCCGCPCAQPPLPAQPAARPLAAPLDPCLGPPGLACSLGNEFGAVHKPWESADIRFALTYPEVYEGGSVRVAPLPSLPRAGGRAGEAGPGCLLGIPLLLLPLWQQAALAAAPPPPTPAGAPAPLPATQWAPATWATSSFTPS